jgi:hypothetical protein
MTVNLTPSTGEETFVALHEAKLRAAMSSSLHLQRVENAPRISVGDSLSISEEDALFTYYEVPPEGVVPTVANLVSALVTHDQQVSETDVDHPGQDH